MLARAAEDLWLMPELLGTLSFLFVQTDVEYYLYNIQRGALWVCNSQGEQRCAAPELSHCLPRQPFKCMSGLISNF